MKNGMVKKSHVYFVITPRRLITPSMSLLQTAVFILLKEVIW